MRLRLVGKAEHRHRAVRTRDRTHVLDEPAHRRGVGRLGRSRDIGAHAHMLAKGAERNVIARKTRTTEAQPANEIARPDALVGAEGIGYYIDVAAWDHL